MVRRYLILDCNYLAHRAKHVFGDLSHGGSATGVVFGFLNDILNLAERFDTPHFIFCWDSKKNKRRELFPAYKANRKKEKRNRQEEEFEQAFRLQIKKLRTLYLQTIGFRNVLQQPGYESDDLIATTCLSLVPKLEEGVIVTADQDLLQLIRSNIHWYNPRSHETITLQRFRKEFGVHPKQWAKVKAIAGCTSDNVPGIPGVGEKTALKYIRGELDKTSKAYKSIKASWQGIVLRNRPLVQLPLKGTKTFKLERDHISQTGWNKVTKRLGMKSIRYRKIR